MAVGRHHTRRLYVSPVRMDDYAFVGKADSYTVQLRPGYLLKAAWASSLEIPGAARAGVYLR